MRERENDKFVYFTWLKDLNIYTLHQSLTLIYFETTNITTLLFVNKLKKRRLN